MLLKVSYKYFISCFNFNSYHHACMPANLSPFLHNAFPFHLIMLLRHYVHLIIGIACVNYQCIMIAQIPISILSQDSRST